MNNIQYLTGQITIIPKPELLGHWGIPLQSPPFRGFPNRRQKGRDEILPIFCLMKIDKNHPDKMNYLEDHPS